MYCAAYAEKMLDRVKGENEVAAHLSSQSHV